MAEIIYALDFETNTKYPGDGLDPTNEATSITSAAIYWGPLSPDDKTPEGAVSFDDPCEQRLLISVRDFFQSPWTKPGTIIGWNTSGFDIPFLITRAGYHKTPLYRFNAQLSEFRKSKYKPLRGHAGSYILKWDKHDHADIWPAFVTLAENVGIKSGLKPVAQFLGLSPIEVDRTKMEDLTVGQRSAYNLSDVEATFKAAQMMAELYEDGVIDYPFDFYKDSRLFEEKEE